jgi:hypothetical protein
MRNVQSDDVGVCAHLENIDFSAHFLGHLQVFDLALIQNFHGDFKARHHMMRNY